MVPAPPTAAMTSQERLAKWEEEEKKKQSSGDTNLLMRSTKEQNSKVKELAMNAAALFHHMALVPLQVRRLERKLLEMEKKRLGDVSRASAVHHCNSGE